MKLVREEINGCEKIWAGLLKISYTSTLPRALRAKFLPFTPGAGAEGAFWLQDHHRHVSYKKAGDGSQVLGIQDAWQWLVVDCGT